MTADQLRQWIAYRNGFNVDPPVPLPEWADERIDYTAPILDAWLSLLEGDEAIVEKMSSVVMAEVRTLAKAIVTSDAMANREARRVAVRLLAAIVGEGCQMNGAERIVAERQRQLDVEKWTADHDQEHSGGELAVAAACYALPEQIRQRVLWQRNLHQRLWPWDWRWWKPGERIRELEKAGALIAAEIDRLLAIVGEEMDDS